MTNSTSSCTDPDRSADITASFGAITQTFYIYAPLALFLLAFYELNRWRSYIFARKWKSVPHRTPSPLPRGWLQWLLPLLRITDDQVYQFVGLDGYICLRFLRFCIRIALFFAFWGCCVLMPVYKTGKQDLDVNQFGQLTMDNIVGPERLWVSVGFTWMFTLYTVYLVNMEYQSFMDKREEFLEMGDPDALGGAQVAYSVRVENIPKELRTNTALMAYFSRLFPEDVFCAIVHVTITDIEALVERRDQISDKLEAAIIRKRVTGHTPKHTPEGKCCTKEESIPYYLSQLYSLNKEISERVAEVDKQDQELEAQSSGVAKHLNSLFGSMKRAHETVSQSLANPRPFQAGEAAEDEEEGSLHGHRRESAEEGDVTKRVQKGMLTAGKEIVGVGTGLVQAGGGIVTQEFSTLAAVADQGVMNLTRGLKLLTVGSSKASSGYVTFRTLRAVTDAKQVFIASRQWSIKVLPAGDPRDVIFENSTVPTPMRQWREVVTSVGVSIFSVTGWIPLLALCQTLAQIDNLEKVIPAIKSLNTDSILYDLLANQLPVILQLILLSLVPVVLESISTTYERKVRKSEVQQTVLSRYFSFQMVNIYATIFSSTLLQTLRQIINYPSCAFEILGQSVPAVAPYFIQMILIKALFGLPLELSRLPVVLNVWLSRHLENKKLKTKKQKRKQKEDAGEFKFGFSYPDFLLVVVIMFTYVTITPIVAPCALLYFITAYIVYKHQFLYVYVPKYETGGEMLPTFFNYTLTGLNFANVTMLGYMFIKNGWSQFATLTPLVPMIEFFRRYCRNKYAIPTKVLSRQAAVDLDDREEPIEVDFDPNLYRQTALDDEPIIPDMTEEEMLDSGVSLTEKDLDSPLLSSEKHISYGS